jgi:hypothetical protein
MWIEFLLVEFSSNTVVCSMGAGRVEWFALSACGYVGVCVCVCVCVHACVHACVLACVCVGVCVIE